MLLQVLESISVRPIQLDGKTFVRELFKYLELTISFFSLFDVDMGRIQLQR